MPLGPSFAEAVWIDLCNGRCWAVDVSTRKAIVSMLDKHELHRIIYSILTVFLPSYPALLLKATLPL